MPTSSDGIDVVFKGTSLTCSIVVIFPAQENRSGTVAAMQKRAGNLMKHIQYISAWRVNTKVGLPPGHGLRIEGIGAVFPFRRVPLPFRT